MLRDTVIADATQPKPPKPEAGTDYNNIDDIITNMQIPKKEYVEDEPPTTPPPPASEKKETEQPKPGEPEPVKPPSINTLKNANWFVKNIDHGIEFIAGDLIAMADDTTPFHATPQDIQELSEYWAEAFPEFLGKIPAWAKLLISSFIIYGPVFRQAIKVRGVNMALAERAAAAEAAQYVAEEKLKNKQQQQENENINNAAKDE